MTEYIIKKLTPDLLEDYFDFLYNRAYKIIATDEIGCSREWEVLDSEDFYYTINLN